MEKNLDLQLVLCSASYVQYQRNMRPVLIILLLQVLSSRSTYARRDDNSEIQRNLSGREPAGKPRFISFGTIQSWSQGSFLLFCFLFFPLLASCPVLTCLYFCFFFRLVSQSCFCFCSYFCSCFSFRYFLLFLYSIYVPLFSFLVVLKFFPKSMFILLNLY